MQQILLLVDEDPNILHALEEVFQKDGYQVFSAICGTKGLELLSKVSVQVIISEQRMSNMTGIEFLLQIKKLYPETFRILLSSFEDFNSLKFYLVKDAINDGTIHKILTKPWNNEVLHEMIKLAFKTCEIQNKSKQLIKTEADEELKRLQKQFLENMSHEIRTPLNGLIGFSEILINGIIDKNSIHYKEYIQDILDSSNILSRLLSNILDLAQAESEELKFNPEPINLSQVITEVSNALSRDMIRKRISIEKKISPALTEIVTDSEKFKAILNCYLFNAIKFSHNNGKIEIFVLPENKHEFRIEVKDYGIGIGDKDIKKIFQMFPLSDTAKNYFGAGIELALVRKIVEQQGGKVGVKSTLGKGSTFFAILPKNGLA